MSGSSPPASLPVDKTCLVCGSPASLRCGACASKSSIDLFFCSTAHQRLMWPYHKLVCGQRAHPFRLPPVSESEAEIAIDMLTAKPTDPRLIHFQAAAKQLSVQTFVDCLSETRWSHATDQSAAVRELIGLNGALATVEGVTTVQQSVIRQLRYFRYHWTPKIRTMSDQDFIIAHIGCVYAHMAQGACTGTVGLGEWHSRFCHLLLANAAIHEVAKWRGTDTDDPATMPNRGPNQFPSLSTRLLTLFAAASSPEEAATAVRIAERSQNFRHELAMADRER